MTKESELEEITRQEHDKLYDELLSLSCDNTVGLIKYYQNLCEDRKKYHIKYLINKDTGEVKYKKISQKRIGYKLKNDDTEEKK